jgi:RimJ/RimL family protein N-acetyltransferase
MNNWPLSGITVRTSRVELRWPSPQDLDALADLAVQGVHAPDFMPFFSEWTDGDRDTVARRVLQRTWGAMASWTPGDWTLYLVVVHQGEVIGSQGIGARDFAVTREVLLTSWLGLRHQGLGLGGHARAGILELAFTGLGAEHVFSVVRRENAASQAVCRKFGFTHDGTQINAVRRRPAVSDRFRLSRREWASAATIQAQVSGLDSARDMFGLGPDASVTPAPNGARRPLADVLSGVQYAQEPDHTAD